jgi:hypothetical protein
VASGQHRAIATDIPALRLINHGLRTPVFDLPEEVVEHLGAVQAQDFAGAKWGISLRMKHATDASLNDAFNDGRILRTHVMRPTWHFVLPEDIRWMSELSAPRLRRLLAPYDRKLELTAPLIRRCKKIIGDALKGNCYLTRGELAARLAKEKIRANGQRLAHIVIHAEVDALVCSGPLRGKQLTYALVEERAGRERTLSHSEGMTLLASRYLRSHGPATTHDFAGWSGCTIKDAQTAIESLGSRVHSERVGGEDYLRLPIKSSATVKSPHALLLTVFDEYTIAYRNWDLLADKKEMKQKMFAMGNGVGNLVVIDGRIAGTWRRNVSGSRVLMTIALSRSLNAKERSAVKTRIRLYEEFLGKEVVAMIG